MIRRVEDDEEVKEQYLPVPSKVGPNLDHLPPEKQTQMRELITSPVFSEVVNRAHKDNTVVHKMSYRIPEWLLKSLKEEIDLMLSLSITEPSDSEWCHPVVLVPKKDDTIHFCIAFRYLIFNHQV